MENMSCFQILGFDIMINANLRPVLIEINQMPSFATDSTLDLRVKRGLLTDCFKILGLNMKRKKAYKAEKFKKLHDRLMKSKKDVRVDAALDDKNVIARAEAERKRKAEEKARL